MTPITESDRAIGQYPISIATSLALESANGIHPEIAVKSQPILKYDELWINVRTLYRNIIGALDKELVGRITPVALANTLVYEIEMIKSIISESTNDKIKIVFYYSNYAKLETHYKFALIRVDNTDKQKEYTEIHNQTMRIILDQQEKDKTNNIIVFDLHVSNNKPSKALILTNYAFDLLSYKDFIKLSLLESHTGHIKDRAQWYTKFANGSELSQIPFTAYFLEIFGDSQTFKPFNFKLRKEILEIANKYNWSAITTYDKIKYGIETMKDEYEKKIILAMMKEK